MCRVDIAKLLRNVVPSSCACRCCCCCCVKVSCVDTSLLRLQKRTTTTVQSTTKKEKLALVQSSQPPSKAGQYVCAECVLFLTICGRVNRDDAGHRGVEWSGVMCVCLYLENVVSLVSLLWNVFTQSTVEYFADHTHAPVPKCRSESANGDDSSSSHTHMNYTTNSTAMSSIKLVAPMGSAAIKVRSHCIVNVR